MDPLNKERHELENGSSLLLSTAIKSGADSAEVFGVFEQQSRIALEKQDYHLASNHDKYEFGLRVMLGNQQGFASTNSTESSDLKETVSKAIQIAKLTLPNPFQTILPSNPLLLEAPQESFDNNLFSLSLQTQKEWTKHMIDEALKEPRFKLDGGHTAKNGEVSVVMNSKGTHKHARDTNISWSLIGMGGDGDNITSMDYFERMSRTTHKTVDQMISSAKHLCESLVSNLKSGNGKSYKGIVAFSPKAVIEILFPAISYQLNGRMLAEGTTRWGLNDISRNIFHSDLTIEDLPWLSDRFGHKLFDREGTPTKNVLIVEAGRLKTFMLDHYAALALGLTSTGHAFGGPTQIPGLSPHCFVLRGGHEPLLDIIKRTTQVQKDFLLVNRFSGRVDSVTGDFSGVAKGGEWWSQGERLFHVKETLISGNTFNILGNSIFGISKETSVINSREESPTLMLNDVSVTCRQ